MGYVGYYDNCTGKNHGKIWYFSPKMCSIWEKNGNILGKIREKKPMIFRSVEHPLIEVNYMLINGIMHFYPLISERRKISFFSMKGCTIFVSKKWFIIVLLMISKSRILHRNTELWCSELNLRKRGSVKKILPIWEVVRIDNERSLTVLPDLRVLPGVPKKR